MELKTKVYKAKINKTNKKEGIIEAIVSVFGVVDSYKDVVEKGAFEKSLKRKLPVGVWMHNQEKTVAKTLEARETETGLYIKGQFNLDTQRGREAFSDIDFGIIDEFSIGYIETDSETDKDGIRHLKEVDLIEWSPVVRGACPTTELLEVKSAIPHNKYSLADEDMEWDAAMAEFSIREWAGGPEKENIDWDKYKEGFTWYDEENRENLGSYKLPHHQVIGGELKTVWRGVVAAMGALMGARGGVDIPEADWDGCYNHLARHYNEFGKEPPEKSKSETIETNEGAEETQTEETQTEETQTEDGETQETQETQDNEKLEEQKAGRVLSAKNRAVIEYTISQLEELNKQIKTTLIPLKELLDLTADGGDKVDRRHPEVKKVIRIREGVKKADRALENVLRIIKSK